MQLKLAKDIIIHERRGIKTELTQQSVEREIGNICYLQHKQH